MPDLYDALDAAAGRESEFHPSTPTNKPITAWTRRATTLKAHADAILDLDRRVDELMQIRESLLRRPF